MKSLSTIGLALSVTFGCLLLALLAEVYYLLWWKKRITRRGIEDGPAKEIFYFLCGKKQSSSSPPSSNPQKHHGICSSNTHVHEPQPQQQQVHGDSTLEEAMEAELLRLSGPPRFLFTIKEETKEDLESSEDGKSRSDTKSRNRSLSDVLIQMQSVETPPFLTPIASPPYFTPPLTPNNDFEFYKSCCSSVSPPPTFKFLRDAEEKLHRSKMLELEAQRFGFVKKKDSSIDCCPKDQENGSFITLIFPRNKEGGHENHHHQQQQQNDTVSASIYPSSSSQVLPLANSPPNSHSSSSFRPLHIKSFTR